MQFWSTHYLTSNGTTSTNHPGVSVEFSAGGTKLFSVGKGDDTSQVRRCYCCHHSCLDVPIAGCCQLQPIQGAGQSWGQLALFACAYCL